MKTKKLLSYLTMGVLFTGVAFADDSDVMDNYVEGAAGYRVDGLQTDSAKGGKSSGTKDTKYKADGLTQQKVKAAEAKDKKTDDTSKSSEEAAVRVGDTWRHTQGLDIQW